MMASGSKTSSTVKPKFSPFKFNPKAVVKDAPIFDIGDQEGDRKSRKRHVMSFYKETVENRPGKDENAESKKDVESDEGEIKELSDKEGPKDEDILEVNAELDSDSDNMIIIVSEHEKTAVEEKDGEKKQSKKHKRHEKREKKKKKHKKVEEDDKEKHEAKKRRKHGKKDRSPSSEKRPQVSSAVHYDLKRAEPRDVLSIRPRDRSRDQASQKPVRGREWRYSPSRFGARSRSRSPRSNIHRKRASPGASPKPKNPVKSPVDKLPRKPFSGDKVRTKSSSRDKFRHDKSSVEKSSTDDMFGDKSRRDTSPPSKKKPRKQKSLLDKPPKEKSKEKPSREKSPVDISASVESPVDISSVEEPVEEKLREKKSPRGKEIKEVTNPPGVESPADEKPANQVDEENPRKKSDGDTPRSKDQIDEHLKYSDQSLTKPSSKMSSADKARSPRQKSPVIAVKSPMKLPRASPIKSPPATESPRKTAGDLSVPVGVVVPYVVEDMSISETEHAVVAKSESDTTKEIHKAIEEGVNLERKKKKKKVKKATEGKKKKRREVASDLRVERISDDELEALLFKKTNKESKFEDVFHDSDMVTTKEETRASIVDAESLPQEDTGATNRPECHDITPVASPTKAEEIYEPEEPTETTPPTKSVPPLAPPPLPPIIPGTTIPFLATTNETIDTKPDDDELYSIDDPILGLDYDSSPENLSTVNLSDISTKDSNVASTVGSITREEKIVDFLDRMPGTFEEPGVVDMEVASPANGVQSPSDNDDDIIEQLHKEFVKAQEKQKPGSNLDDTVASDVYEPTDGFSPSYEPGEEVLPNSRGRSTKHNKKKGGSRGRKQKNSHKKHKSSHVFAKEKREIESALNRVHRQARVEDEMKLALKPYYQHKDITKEEYKTILRKAVPQVTNTNHSIDPERIRSLMKKYVAKHKGAKLHDLQNTEHSNDLVYSPNHNQDFSITFSP